MPSGKILATTARLKLRHWRQEDLTPFAALNADPKVMEYFPSPLTRMQSDSLAAKIRSHFDDFGFGLWAVEEIQSRRFIGFVGLQHIADNLPVAPAVEIGWRLATEFWGKGYATEAAKSCLKFGFESAKLAEVIAITTLQNMRSQSVMQRLGMEKDSKNFQHPALAPNHPLRTHCVYRLRQEQWFELG